MAKIKILDTRVDGLYATEYDLRAETYLTQLHDSRRSTQHRNSS
jgi:hypothetical protein